MTKKQEKALKRLLRMSGWSKQSGYAEAKHRLIIQLLMDAGFKQKKSLNSAHAYDTAVCGVDTFVHPIGLTARWYERIGSHRWDNSYAFNVLVKGASR